METTKLKSLFKFQRTRLGVALLVVTATFFLIPTMSWAQNNPPVVDAGEDQSIYVGEATVLQGSATDPDGNVIVSYLWTVESAPAGSSPSFSNPAHPWANFSADVAGDYVLSLVASDGIVWSDPDFVTIHVLEILEPVAVASADVTGGHSPLTVQFDGSASTVDPNLGPLTFSWSFGDGEISSEVSPTHTYVNYGVYSVALRVFDTLNQNDYDTIEIYVGTPADCLSVDPGYMGYYLFGYPPVGSSNPQLFTISNTCSTTDLEIDSIILADGSSADFAITSVLSLPYTLGPGETVGVEVTFTPSTPYHAEANLVIQSDDSVSPELTIWLTTSMNHPPIVDAGEDQNISVGEATVLQGSATDPDGHIIISYLWTVESAPVGSSPSFSNPADPGALFTADLAGDYVLSLVASDGIDTSVPDYVTIHVREILEPEAVADADVTSGPAPLTVHFDGSASTSDPAAEPLTYDWSFGDGEFSTEVSPTHTYIAPGVYTIILTVFDTLGQSDLDTIEITVTTANNPPEAAPTGTPNTGVAPLVVQFAANATDPDGDPLTYLWDFGDPDSLDNTSTLADPQHVYESPGTYVAWLTVSDGELEISASLTIRVTEDTGQTPQEMIQDLIGEVDNYVDTGSLTCFQGWRLRTLLDLALNSFDNDRTRLAKFYLNRFVYVVEQFIQRGVISTSEGQILIDAANEIIEAING